MMLCGSFGITSVTKNLPRVAVRFLEAVRRTVEELRKHPHVGPPYRTENSRLQKLRSWPVTGFEAIRIYYVPEDETVSVIRILHGKRDVKRILQGET